MCTRVSPEKSESRMNNNGVRWGGGVGAVTPQADVKLFLLHLAGRYFPTLGQPKMAASYFQDGVPALADVETPMM